MIALRCCFRSQAPKAGEASQTLHLSGQAGNAAQPFHNHCSQEQLVEALLISSRAADVQDWVHRCSMQLETAAALLGATIRVFITNEDGRKELILASSSTKGSALSGPANEAMHMEQADVLVSKMDAMEQSVMGVDQGPFGVGSGAAPLTVQYLPGNSGAAVPLSCGTECFGVLLLTADEPGTRCESALHHTRGSPLTSGAELVDISSFDAQLRQLAMALSLALTPKLPALRRLASSLTRLSAAASLREIVGELCDALSYHVRQRFLLEPSVRAAVVAEPDATTAFLLDLNSVPHGLQGRRLQPPPSQQEQQQHLQPEDPQMQQAHPSLSNLSQPVPPFPPPQQQQVLSQLPLPLPRPGGSPGAALQSVPRCRSTPSSNAVSPAPSLTAMTWDSTLHIQKTAPPSLLRGEPTRLLGATRPSGVRSPPPLNLQWPELSTAVAEGGGPHDSTTAPQPVPLSPGCVTAACEAAGGSVVARPFQLSYSLLLRLQLQQPRMCGLAVRDCIRLVQDVNQPSHDICLLMGTAGAASATALAAGAGLPGARPIPQTSSLGLQPGDAGSSVCAGALGVQGALSTAGAVSVGASAAAGAGGACVQSLALVGCHAGDGTTLAFYVCFPQRLPGPLVEAVRDSCQRLLDRVLLRAVAPKVSGELAAELGALRRGIPGTFAVVQMPYSRMGSRVGCAAAAPVEFHTSPLPASQQSASPPSASANASSVGIVQPLTAPASAASTSAAAASGGGGWPLRSTPRRDGRMQHSVATSRLLVLQLETGPSGSGGGGTGVNDVLHVPLSAAVGAAGTARVGSDETGIASGGGAVGAGVFSDLLSNARAAVLPSARSAATARPVRNDTLPPPMAGPSNVVSNSRPAAAAVHGAGGGAAASDRAGTVAREGSGTTTTGSVGVLPQSRGPTLGGTSLLHASGAESWIQIPAANTGRCSATDVIQTFLSSVQGISASESQPAEAYKTEMLQRAASVIVVRDLEVEARGGCQQQLGALVSSVRESITMAAASAGIGAGAGPYMSTLEIAVPQMYEVVGVGGGTCGRQESALTRRPRATAPPGVVLHRLDLQGAAGQRCGSGTSLGFVPTGPSLCSTAATGEPGAGAAAAAAAAAASAAAACGLDSEAADVADLQILSKLGQGGGGAVFLGQVAGGLGVAVKLLELPGTFDVASFVDQFWPGPQLARGKSCGLGAGPSEGEFEAVLAAEAARQQVRARRSLLQSATELAMLTSVSHPNIVQVYGIYSNVVLETRFSPDETPSYRLRHQSELQSQQQIDSEVVPPGSDEHRTELSNVCSAVCMTLCDLGSVASALAGGRFPGRVGPAATHGSVHPSAPPAAAAAATTATAAAVPLKGPPEPASVEQPVDVNSPVFGAEVLKHMRSVYLTLLEVALALRYLHGRNIVHRDLKPGNILLKSRSPTPGDPRGFTTKLADFGLALVLDCEATPAQQHQHQQLQPFEDLQSPLQEYGKQPPTGTAGAPGRGLDPTRAAGRDPRVARTAPERFVLQDQACGTVDHMAPEVCQGRGSRLTAAADIYSFGVVMLEVVTGGRRPFGAAPPDRIARLVSMGTRPVFPAWVPTQYRSLAEACWAQDPQRRPSAAQLVGAIRQLLQRCASPGCS